MSDRIKVDRKTHLTGGGVIHDLSLFAVKLNEDWFLTGPSEAHKTNNFAYFYRKKWGEEG